MRITILTTWLALLALLLGWSMGFHLAAFRTPKMPGFPDEPGITAHHFLSAKCRCSEAVLAHLVSRKTHNGVREIVHLIDAESYESRTALSEAGFQLELSSGDEVLKRYGVTAVPLLVITRDGRFAYQGAYAWNQKKNRVYDDVSILDAAQRGEPIATRPIFGCANGRAIQKSLDPWGLIYE